MLNLDWINEDPNLGEVPMKRLLAAFGLATLVALGLPAAGNLPTMLLPGGATISAADTLGIQAEAAGGPRCKGHSHQGACHKNG
jgi:hypothetical protein